MSIRVSGMLWWWYYFRCFRGFLLHLALLGCDEIILFLTFKFYGCFGSMVNSPDNMRLDKAMAVMEYIQS